MSLPAHPPETRKRALTLLAEPGASLRSVARETGVSVDALRRWAAAAGIKMTSKGGRPPKEKTMKTEERVTKEILATIRRVGAEVRAGEIQTPQVGSKVRDKDGRHGEIVGTTAAPDGDCMAIKFADGVRYEITIHDGTGAPDPLRCEWESEPGDWERLIITEAEMEAMFGDLMNAAKLAAGEHPMLRGPGALGHRLSCRAVHRGLPALGRGGERETGSRRRPLAGGDARGGQRQGAHPEGDERRQGDTLPASRRGSRGLAMNAEELQAILKRYRAQERRRRSGHAPDAQAGHRDLGAVLGLLREFRDKPCRCIPGLLADHIPGCPVPTLKALDA